MTNLVSTSGWPSVVILLTGKRKSGKDYVANLIESRAHHFNIAVNCLRISAPLKREYAQRHCLSYADLLSSSAYKELYRKDMVTWGERVRLNDPSYFCRQAVADALKNGANDKIWIVVDCRRPSDMDYFQSACREHNCQVLRVRVKASDLARSCRGWTFTAGVDDEDTECALDNMSNFDIVLENDDDSSIRQRVNSLVDELRAKFIENNRFFED